MSDESANNAGQVQDNRFLLRPVGSLAGLIISLFIGLAIFYGLNAVHGLNAGFSYNDIVAKAATNPFYKLLWMFMNFTDANFYAGIFAGIFLIIGGFVAWKLDVNKSRFAGFDICYGTNMWPWVFSSQIISILLTLFLFNYTRILGTNYTWLPTFITIVGAPPALMLIYGPNWRALITGTVLGALISYPIAFWIMTKIIPVLGVPEVVANVSTMAITGIIMAQVFKVLPWIKKEPLNPIDKGSRVLTKEETIKELSKPSWFIRRVLADFTEAPFYGNEVAGIFLLLGVIIDFVVNIHHPAYGSGVLPAIILSQIVGSAVGIYLYFNKYVELGWYATFVPVVSVGPACVLMFGGSISVAVVAGVLGAIIGGPYAEYISRKLPEDFHPTIANVTSMAVCTIIVYVVMKALPWF